MVQNNFKEIKTTKIIESRMSGSQRYNDDVLHKRVNRRLKWLSEFYDVEVDYIYDAFVQYPEDGFEEDFDPTKHEDPAVVEVAKQILAIANIIDTCPFQVDRFL